MSAFFAYFYNIIVWGNAGDTIVWGDSTGGDTVVWGNTVIWGS